MRLLLAGKECDALSNAEKLKKYCIESGYSIHTVAFMPSTEMNDVYNELKDAIIK